MDQVNRSFKNSRVQFPFVSVRIDTATVHVALPHHVVYQSEASSKLLLELKVRQPVTEK